MTEKYPDLVALMPHIRGQGTESFILEGEVVAVDDQGSVKTFQALAGRGKKNVGLSEVKVQVCLYAFDLMYLNGKVYNPHNRFLMIEFTGQIISRKKTFITIAICRSTTSIYMG
jgi:hypothetical protein